MNIEVSSNSNSRENKPPERAKEKKSHANWISTNNESDDSDIENDLVNNIKHHTISSVSALKDMINSEEDVDRNSSFFQQYFHNHSNPLPSRNVLVSRRLSQCREEDEDDEKTPVSDLATISGSDKSLSESSSGSKTSVIDTITGPTHKFVITKTKQPPDGSDYMKAKDDNNKKPSEAAKVFAKKSRYVQSNTVHFPTDSKRPSVYSIFNRAPHYDSKFFDSSLIEIKSQTSSTSALDIESNEDIWIKRSPTEIKKELGSQPLPTTTSDDIAASIPRPRSGTWGSKADHKETHKEKEKRKSKEKSKQENKSKNDSKSEAKQQKDKKKDKGSRSGSASRSSSAERRKSVDELQSPKKPGMLDVLRGRSGSDASKKKGLALMMTMFHTNKTKTPRDGSAHPVKDGPHTQYYHTVTAASTSRSPMTKVMDIFRNRPHSNIADDKRKRLSQPVQQVQADDRWMARCVCVTVPSIGGNSNEKR
ncbi:hypothetical protein Trydic_g22797 [Trypoxylus dichotomus]